MSIPCPCCGAPLESLSIDDLKQVTLTQSQRRVVDALIRRYPRGLTTEALIEDIYSEDPNGGPLCARNTVHVFLMQLRRALPKHGWTITNSGRGRGNSANYRLARVVS